MMLRAIPKKIKDELLEKDFMQAYCIHSGRERSSECEGRSTWEHPYGRVREYIGIVVPCCEKHNVGVSGEEKAYNKLMAIDSHGIERFEEISPKVDWEQERKRLIYVTSKEVEKSIDK